MDCSSPKTWSSVLKSERLSRFDLCAIVCRNAKWAARGNFPPFFSSPRALHFHCLKFILHLDAPDRGADPWEGEVGRAEGRARCGQPGLGGAGRHCESPEGDSAAPRRAKPFVALAFAAPSLSGAAPTVSRGHITIRIGII